MSQSWSGEKEGWDISCMSGEATNTGKKIPYESRMAHSKFPMNGLAGVMK